MRYLDLKNITVRQIPTLIARTTNTLRNDEEIPLRLNSCSVAS